MEKKYYCPFGKKKYFLNSERNTIPNDME